MLFAVIIGACNGAAATGDGGSSGAIACGAGSCDVSTGAACCVQPDASACGPQQPCPGGVLIQCYGAADCGGQRCCFDVRNVNSIASCAATCGVLLTACRSNVECPSNAPHCCAEGVIHYCRASPDPSVVCD